MERQIKPKEIFYDKKWNQGETKFLHLGSSNPCERFPKKYHDAHASWLKIDKDSLNSVREWLKTKNSFLIFMGRAGCGKTYFSYAMVKYIWENGGKREEEDIYKVDLIRNEDGKVIERKVNKEIVGKRIKIIHPEIEYINIIDFYERIKRCYEKNISDEEIKNFYKKVQFLVIDDLGASLNSDWQIQIFYEIIDYRYSHCFPTIITSNLDFDEIEKRFHQRIRSRLEDKSNCIIFDWDRDMRHQGI